MTAVAQQISTDVTTVATRVRDRAQTMPDRIALREKDFGIWQEVSWAEYWNYAELAGHAAEAGAAMRGIGGALLLLLLSACATTPPGPAPAQVQADIVRRIPATVPDRDGWATDIRVAFEAQGIAAQAVVLVTDIRQDSSA